MKKIAAIVLSVGVLLGTAGCSPQQETDDRINEVVVTLKDGRTMPCIKFGSSYGSVDCDWANAK